MMSRDRIEKDCRRLFSDYNYGTTIWSPLAGGILAGKYNDGNIPEGSRYDTEKYLESVWKKYFNPEKKEKTVKMLNNLAEFAKSKGYTQAQLCLAWVIASRDVSTCILGFSRIEQVEENFKAMELYKKWDAAFEAEVEAILGTQPESELDWRTVTP